MVQWNCLGQYISRSVEFFSKTAHKIFLKFCIKLGSSGSKNKGQNYWCVFFNPKNGVWQTPLWFYENRMFWKNVILQSWIKMLSTSQIAILCDHQSLRKESIDNLDFLYGDNHEMRVAFEATTTFGWVFLVLPLVQSYVWFFDHEYL